MNLTKLKSNIIIVFALLFVNCPADTKARQLCRFISNTSDITTNKSNTYQSVSDIDTLIKDNVRRSAELTMSMVLRHLPEQNPLSFDSYSAILHHQFKIAIDSLSKTGNLLMNERKSTINQTNSLFSVVTLTSQKRLKPGFSLSEKLSDQSEGTDNGSFNLLSSHLRDISLLDQTIQLFDKSFFPPLSEAAIKNYYYHSSDSITPYGDTLQIISFRPKEANRFNGFRGTVLIDTKKFDIHQIIAQSTQNNPKEPLLLIHQNYEPINGIWLPSEKMIKVFFFGKTINLQDLPVVEEDQLVVECLTTIYQQQINPPLIPDDFKKTITVVIPKPAPTVTRTKNYLYIPFSQSDSLTQLKADSAIRAEFRNQKTKMIRLLAEGNIPLGYFNLDYNKIFGYNLYEGIKLGIGGETSRQLSHHFMVGGYISYGLKDKSLRHGEWINIYPTGRSDLRIHLGYRDMNLEFGAPEFLETRSLLNPESYRTLLIKNMYATKRYAAGLQFRPLIRLNVYLFGDLSDNHARQNTSFLILHPFNPFSVTRAGLQLRYSPGLKSKTEDGRLNEMTAPKSDYYLTITQGLSILGGQYRYTKLELKGKFDLPFSAIGTTTILMRGGTMTQNGPITELFNGYGSFAGTFSLAAPYSFGTMQLNEFAAANYMAMHLRHDFSPWLFSGKTKTNPAFVFAQNIGVGQLNDLYMAQFNLKDFRKGFYESGFEVNNILRMDFLSFGAGIYYRYGPYQFSSAHDNFAYKFGFLMKL